MPAAAFVMSPYADLTLAGTTMRTKHEIDPLLSRENLQPRVTDYTAGQDVASRADQPRICRPVRAAAPDHPGRNSRGSPRRRGPPRGAGRHRRRRGHARHHPPGAPRFPGLPPDPRRSGRRWTEPDSSCRRISPVQNTSPARERQNARCPHDPKVAGFRWISRPPPFAQVRGPTRLETTMSPPNDQAHDWNRKTIEEFRAEGGKVGGNFAEAPLLLLHNRRPQRPGTGQPHDVSGSRRRSRRGLRHQRRRADTSPTGTTTWSPIPTSLPRSAPTPAISSPHRRRR